MSFPLRVWMEKVIPWLSGKEKALGAAVIKEDHADCLLGHKDLIFFLKMWNYKEYFQLLTPSSKLILYIYMYI